MRCTVTSEDDAVARLVVLSGEADVAAAAELRRALLDALVPGRHTRLDLSALERLDTAGIQIVLCAHRYAEEHGATLTVIPGDGPARNALCTSGALGLLHLAEAARNAPLT